MALADGLSTATGGLGIAWLNTIRGGGAGTSYTAPAAITTKLHTGIPGAAGTLTYSVGSTAAVATTFGAASAGAIALSNSPQWTNGGTGETITNVSCWDSSTYLFSGLLGSSKAWASTDTLTLTTFTVSLTPLATT